MEKKKGEKEMRNRQRDKEKVDGKVLIGHPAKRANAGQSQL